MLKNRNQVYIFSTSRASLGTIIACRSETGEDVIGKNIFTSLGISSTEQSVFRSRYQDGDCFVLMKSGNKPRGAVAFFKSFGYGISLATAVEWNVPVGAVSQGVQEVYPQSVISDACRKVAERKLAGSFSTEDVEAVADVARTFALMSAMTETGGEFDLLLLERILEGSSRLLGVDVAYGHCGDGEAASVMKDGLVFDGASMVSVLAVMMTVAGTYAADGMLQMLVGEEAGRPLLEISFAGERDAGWESVLQTLFQKIEIYHNHVFDCSYHKGRVRLIFSPYYEDVGVTGVKRRDVLLRYYPEDAREDPVEVINFLSYGE